MSNVGLVSRKGFLNLIKLRIAACFRVGCVNSKGQKNFFSLITSFQNLPRRSLEINNRKQEGREELHSSG